MALMIECCSLNFAHGRKVILENICFKAEAGVFLGVLGRNGSGKTTLLHCLNRILEPASGSIFIDQDELSLLTPGDIARKISLVPQEHLDIFPYKVIDVIAMARAPFLKVCSSPDENDYKIAMDALRQLNAINFKDKNFNRISGGERQITLLARAIAQTTKIMLLDEPTNHLDFNNQYHLLSAIRNLVKQKNLCVVASMHDPSMAALFCDQIIMIKNRKIIVQGTREKVMTEENISRLYGTETCAVKINRKKNIFLPNHIIEME